MMYGGGGMNGMMMGQGADGMMYGQGGGMNGMMMGQGPPNAMMMGQGNNGMMMNDYDNDFDHFS
jgi:hypothetical protein